jgi:hypothetical protein
LVRRPVKIHEKAAVSDNQQVGDVAGQIPINFVTTSAVSLRAACFGDNIYDRDAAATGTSGESDNGQNIQSRWSDDQ